MSELETVVANLSAARHDRTHNQEAWNIVFQHTWPYVFSLALRHVSDVQAAEDLGQTVFLKLISRWNAGKLKIESATSLLALLAVVTKRLATDSRRYEHRLRRDESRLIDSVNSGDLAASKNVTDGAELNDLLTCVAGKLNLSEQQVLSLRIQGYNVEEIAKKLSVSTRTIHRKLSVIKDLLADLIMVEGE